MDFFDIFCLTHFVIYRNSQNALSQKISKKGSARERYFELDGVRYHHIIDPSNGKPTNNDLRSVTIVCDNGTLADCLSTAMFVLGENGAMKYWRNNGGFEMIMITTDDEVICTSGLIEVFTLTDPDNFNVSFVE